MPRIPPPHRLRIDIDGASPGGVVLRLEGELDADTAPDLERSITGLSRPGPVLVLDLHALSFLDSLGLNMLFRAREWAVTRDVALRIVRAPVHVQRLIAIAAMESSLGPFYADADAALRA
jgi:anti-anti-sigma factor